MNQSTSIFKNTKKLILLGIFIALGAIFMLIEIPYPLVPFLNFDLSEVVILVTVETFGFIPAVIVAIFKAIVHFSVKGMTTPYAIGQITSIIASISVAAFYLVAKKYIKVNGVRQTIIRSIITVAGFSAVLTICNYFFITPIYFGELWYTAIQDWLTLDSFMPWTSADLGYGTIIALVYIPFNAVKCILILAIYEVLAPRLNKFMKSFK